SLLVRVGISLIEQAVEQARFESHLMNHQNVSNAQGGVAIDIEPRCRSAHADHRDYGARARLARIWTIARIRANDDEFLDVGCDAVAVLLNRARDIHGHVLWQSSRRA